MIRIKMPKHRLIFKVLKDASKEITALTNKVTRRSGDRRLLRNEFEVAISTYIEHLVVDRRNQHICAFSHSYSSDEITHLVQPLINAYSDIDQFKEDAVDHTEELTNLAKVLEASIEEECKKDLAELTSIMKDTKTLCGRSLVVWDSVGDVLDLLRACDMVKCSHETERFYGLQGIKTITECTCSEYIEYTKVEETWRNDPKRVDKPKAIAADGAFWYCKEDGRFFNRADIRNEANANKTIFAYRETNDTAY